MSARASAARARPASPREQARIFSALGDETRLKLVKQLGPGDPVSIASLGAGAKITRQAITKHLHVLEGAGLVHGVKQGREQLWQLQPKRIDEAREALEVISKQWDQALERLRGFVEADP